MPRTFATLTLFALVSLPLVGRAGAEPNRVQFVSRDSHLMQPSTTPGPAAAAESGTEDQATGSAPSRGPIAAPDEPQPELVVERSPNGQVKLKRYVTQDAQRNYVNHGPWTLFDGSGNPIATGNYRLGKREGSWSRMQPKSSKNLEGPAYKGFAQPFVWKASFTDDVLNGVWTMLDAKGRPIRTWEFDQGRLHGKSIDWHANGHKRRELRYEQGIPQGELREWDDTGKLVAQMTYDNGRPHRSFVEKYPTGEKKVQGWYFGAKEMVRVTFNWWEGTMRMDIAEVEEKEIRHGLWVSWYRTGGKQYEGSYERDKPVGPHTWWYANGQKQISGHFVNGWETGRWTWWHENGGRSLEGEFVDGKREGPWATWHANGQKHQAGSYAADKRTGQWSSWDEAGKLIESRDRSADPGETSPVSKPTEPAGPPITDASGKAASGPLSHKSKPVPELLQRWRERGDERAR